jgi:L,D-transpeptidase catalytic domain
VPGTGTESDLTPGLVGQKMSQGRKRGPLSLAVSRKVLVDARCSDARNTLYAAFPQSRRIALRHLSGGLAALVVALGASGRPASAQEMTDPGPGRWQTGWNEVVVSLGAQRLWAYEGEQLVLTTFVSTGTAETPEVATPIGQWRVLVKLPMETMTGTVNGEPYQVPDVPYVMYFTDEGHALHGTYWHNSFGTPMSHGCVNLPMDVAEWMYRWAPEGTAVTVIP